MVGKKVGGACVLHVICPCWGGGGGGELGNVLRLLVHTHG